MNISYVYIFLLISLLYSVRAEDIYDIKIPLSNLIFNLTHNVYDDYVLYFYALSPVPEIGDSLYEQLSHQPFMVFPYPLIPTTDEDDFNFDYAMKKQVRRFSRKQFDAVITPICTPYYVWPNMERSYAYTIAVPRNHPRIPKNLTSAFPYTKVLIDEHGRVTFQEFNRFASTTVFIYIENCDDKTPMQNAINLLPTALLILIYSLRPYGLTLLRQFKYTDSLDQEGILDVSQLHRRLYWKAEGVQDIFHYGYTPAPYASVRPGEHVRDCLSKLPKLMPICSDMTMSVLTLATYVHNNTVYLYNCKDPSEAWAHIFAPRAKFVVTTKIGGWQQDWDNLNLNIKILGNSDSSLERITLFENLHLLYCKRNIVKSSKFEFNVWLYPYNKYTWILAGVLSAIDVAGSFLGCFRYLEDINLKFKRELGRYYLFVFIMCGMMLRGYYENELTSLVTVPESVRGFDSLGEMLESNYRIALHSVGVIAKLAFSAFLHGVAKIFESDFKFRNISSPLNTSFELFVDRLPNSRALYNKTINDSFAFPVFSSLANFEVEILRQSTNMSELTCFKSPFYFYSTFQSYDIKLVNRVWYMQSLGWLDSAGLPPWWREWSLFAEGLRMKLSYGMGKVPEEYSVDNVDDIKLNKINAVMVLIAGLHLLTLIVFCVEVLGKPRKGNKFLVTKSTCKIA